MEVQPRRSSSLTASSYHVQLSNEDYYSQYITEDFRDYVRRKSKPWVHGNHIEIQAMSEMYSRTIEVLCYSSGERLSFIRELGYLIRAAGVTSFSRLRPEPNSFLQSFMTTLFYYISVDAWTLV